MICVMKTAFSYIRFSRLHQQDGDSTRRQRESTEAYCQRNGLVLDDSLKLFDKGVSAFKGRNAEKGALGRFIFACETGLVPKGSALIVESLDRLSRQSPRKTVRLLTELLDDHGIEVHLTMAGKVFKPENEDGVDLIFAVALAMRAHEESETKSKRLEEAFAAKRERAMRGEELMTKSLPWWLVLKGGKIVCPPERAKIVRRIFKETVAGKSSNQIAWQLNKEGIPTWRPKAKFWQDGRVRDLIWSHAPTGTLTETPKTSAMGKSWRIPGYYPQIVSEELAIDARGHIQSNRRSGRPRAEAGPANLLKGLARWKGIWMRFSVHKKKGPKGAYWNGYYEALWPDRPGVAYNIAANQIEPILLTAIAELSTDALAPLTREEPASVRLRAGLGNIGEKIENLAKAVESGSITLAKRLVTLESEQKKMQDALATAEADERAPGADPMALRDMARIPLQDLKDATKRMAIASLIKRLISRVDIATTIHDLPSNSQHKSITAADIGGLLLSSYPDPTGSRGKNPLVILVTFHGGGRRLIFRGADGMPPGIGSARYMHSS